MFHDGTIGELCDSVDSMLIGLARFGDPCRDDGKIYYAELRRIDAENPPDADAQRQSAELVRDRNYTRAIEWLSGALATVKAAAESNTGELRDELRALHTAIENVRKPLEDWLLAMVASTGSRGSASTNGKRDKELVEWGGKANAAIQRALPVSQRIREWHGTKIPHPPLMLMRELNNLQIVGSNVYLYRRLKEARDGHAAMRQQFRGILNDSANERANRIIRDGGKPLDALREFAACDKWDAIPPEPDDAELVTILKDDLKRRRLYVDRARQAIRAGGAKVLDAATKPNAAGQPRSIALNIAMQEAEKVFSGLMIGIANPQVSIDKGIEDLIDLHSRFDRAHDELGAAVETVGLNVPEPTQSVVESPELHKRIERLETVAQSSHGISEPKSTHTNVVLWEGAEASEKNIKLARTRTAYLESNGNVKAALESMKRDGHRIGQSTFYDHLEALDKACPRWRDHVLLSEKSGNLEKSVHTRTPQKSRAKLR